MTEQMWAACCGQPEEAQPSSSGKENKKENKNG